MAVEGLKVKSSAQEDSPCLALEFLEPQKTVSVDGTIDHIDSQMPMIQTYARKGVGKKLLILGTPGAGKTITLLRLAQELVNEAIAQPQTVIPIVFELSTWRDGQEIEDWLIEQLYENYDGNRKWKIYETWVERRVLLPLLDGLDELGMVRQKACTEKVNTFAKTYPQVVVCCRVKEFQQAGVNLSNLRGKVQLQPLTDGQIRDYLDGVGKLGLWEQIQTEMGRLLEPVIDAENPDYDEPGLLRVPLFISLAAQVYKQDEPLKGKADLLDRYIDRQLSFDVREGDRDRKELKGRKWAYKSIYDEPNNSCQTLDYIQWLAKKVVAAEIIEFNLPWLRYGIDSNKDGQGFIKAPRRIAWLDTSKQRSIYRSVCYCIIFLINLGFVILYPNFLKDFLLAHIAVSIFSILGLVIGYLIGKIFNILNQNISGESTSEIVTKFIVLVIIRPTKWIFKVSNSSYKITTLIGFLACLFLTSMSLAIMESLSKIYLVKGIIEATIFSLQEAIKFSPLLTISLIGATVFVLPIGVIVEIVSTKRPTKNGDVISNGNSLSDKEVGLRQPTFKRSEKSLEKIFIEAKNYYPKIEKFLFSWIIGSQIIYCVGYFVLVTNKIMLVDNTAFVLLPLILLMFAIIPPFGDLFGGNMTDLWIHVPKRFILSYSKVMPWNLARFLTYCHERRLLQQIGGRYRFIHRELLEHFARIEN
ncbi:MAG: NACHT domain-containing protein [Cyanobacteria bacterium]|nr:NACHT domain-containing protein [Cyanobacteriota bacterium]